VLSTALAVLAVSTLLLVGCSGAGLQMQAQILSNDANNYVAANPELSSAVKNDIRQHRLREGMSKREVVVAWGRPVLVRNFSRGGLEYWYFGCDWPHTCNYTDQEDGHPLVDEVYQSQAEFKDGKLVYWRS